MNTHSVVEKFAVLDTLPVGVFVVDDQYNILFWNRCMETWTQKRFSDVKGRTLAAVYPHFGQKQYTSRIDPILAGGPPTIFSSQLHGHLFPCALGSGKLRIFQTTVSNIPDWDSKRFYALFAVKDVTELSYRIIESRKIQEQALEEIEQRKTAEEELKRANEKILAQTKTVIEEERLKVLLQMAGATAHELNQPLMILLGNIELLELDRENPEKLMGRIKKINKAGKRIADIIKKIQNVRHVTKKSYSGGDDIIDIHQKERILCVDDQSGFRTIREMLGRSMRSELSHADSIAEAKTMLREKRFDLMILDYILPDGDAFGLLGFLKQEGLSMPVIVLTGQGDDVIASQLFRQGATDYLSKSHMGRKRLMESITFSIEQYHLKRDREKAMLVMGDLSTKDRLTGLFNRRYFREALERETSGTDRYDREMALCLIDIDHFKRVNDTYGQMVGDKVLKRISGFIMDNLRRYDIPCRYDGEAFGILLPNTSKEGALSMCNRIRRDVAGHCFEYDSFSLRVTLSAGIALRTKTRGNRGADLPEHLIQLADDALYQAKHRGRNQVVLA